MMVETGSIHKAARDGNLDQVKCCLETKPELIDERNKYGETPLYFAAFAGKNNVVKFLLQKNADVNAKDFLGETPLSVAVKRGHKSVIKWLKKYGAER